MAQNEEKPDNTDWETVKEWWHGLQIRHKAVGRIVAAVILVALIINALLFLDSVVEQVCSRLDLPLCPESLPMPDGKIAFTSEIEGMRQIRIMDPDGSNIKQITTEGENYAPAWSPNGQKLAFTHLRQLENGWFDSDIYTMTIDGKDRKNVTNAPDTIEDDPVWSPDGNSIAFLSNRGGRCGIWIVNVQNGEPIGEWHPFARFPTTNTMSVTSTVLVTNTALVPEDAMVDWSKPNKIAFRSDRDGEEDIFVVDLNVDPTGQNPDNVTPQQWQAAHSPSLSPSGNEILFLQRNKGTMDLYVLNADGSHSKQITKEPEYVYGGDWSPDGKIIIFSKETGCAEDQIKHCGKEIWAMRADGEQMTQITTDGAQNQGPVWSSKGTNPWWWLLRR